MTDNKRFIIPEYPDCIVDTVEDKEYKMSSYYPHMECICDLLNNLSDENEKLQFELKECYDNKLFSRRKLEKENEQLSAMKLKGLKVLEFYEDKLKNADRKEFENAREELWIIKEVLCEMGVIKE